MKTLISTSIFILCLALFSQAKPINEIYSIQDPFETEESYIDDIPFDTWEIAVESILEGDEVKLQEEPYVNDIPFDTRTIANEYLLRKMVETTSERNVNDIPFNTEKITNQYLTGALTREYLNEPNVEDFPENIKSTTCYYEYPCTYTQTVTVKMKPQKRGIYRNNKNGKYDYTIIHPVMIRVTETDLKHPAGNDEILVIPGSSL